MYDLCDGTVPTRRGMVVWAVVVSNREVVANIRFGQLAKMSNTSNIAAGDAITVNNDDQGLFFDWVSADELGAAHTIEVEGELAIV
jgi:hypothetical protein